jgi:hypothetical protein
MLGLCPSLNMRNQVSRPYKTKGKYILIVTSLGSKREYKSFWPEWSQAFSEFTLFLISLCVQFLHVSVVAKYFNFTTFSKHLLVIFILQFSLHSMYKKWTYKWFYMHLPIEYRIYDAHYAFCFVICMHACMYVRTYSPNRLTKLSYTRCVPFTFRRSWFSWHILITKQNSRAGKASPSLIHTLDCVLIANLTTCVPRSYWALYHSCWQSCCVEEAKFKFITDVWISVFMSQGVHKLPSYTAASIFYCSITSESISTSSDASRLLRPWLRNVNSEKRLTRFNIHGNACSQKIVSCFIGFRIRIWDMLRALYRNWNIINSTSKPVQFSC